MNPVHRTTITGYLETTSALHIGDGRTINHPELTVEESPGQAREIDVQAVSRQAPSPGKSVGLPQITGRSLKGVLRSGLRRLGLSSQQLDDLDQLFGHEDVTDPESVGGKLVFVDCPAQQPPPDLLQQFKHTVPYWRDDHLTGIAAGIGIDRVTRTAAEERLFYIEYVPPKIRFAVTIHGEALNDSELALILLALSQFDGDARNGPTIGGAAGPESGRVKWELKEVQRTTDKDIAAWLKRILPAATPDGSDTAEWTSNEVGWWIAGSPVPEPVLPAAPATRRNVVRLSLELSFDGPFLVNEPAFAKSKVSGKDEPAQRPPEPGSPAAAEKPADHTPRLTVDGRILLPRSSIQRAVRSQAERIVRTIAKPQAKDEYLRSACIPTDKKLACRAINATKGNPARGTRGVEDLCLVCQLFGAGGWKSPLDFTDFEEPVGTPPAWERCLRQEFVAIDRFTGGSSGSAKFDAETVWSPTLHGTLTIDLHRAPKPWMPALLAFTLRDLLEGDVRLGWGGGKGYGECTAALRIVGAVAGASDNEQSLAQLVDCLVGQALPAAGAAHLEKSIIALHGKVDESIRALRERVGS